MVTVVPSAVFNTARSPFVDVASCLTTMLAGLVGVAGFTFTIRKSAKSSAMAIPSYGHRTDPAQARLSGAKVAPKMPAASTKD
jgi:hypothetical protein